MYPAGFWNALGAKILLFCPMSIEVSRSAHAALPMLLSLSSGPSSGFQSVDVAPLPPPLAPHHALEHDIAPFSPAYTLCSQCLGAPTLTPSAFRLWAVLLPHQYGVSWLSGCWRPLIILAFTLFKLQDYHGLVNQACACVGSISPLRQIDAWTACCPSFGVLPSFTPVFSCSRQVHG